MKIHKAKLITTGIHRRIPILVVGAMSNNLAESLGNQGLSDVQLSNLDCAAGLFGELLRLRLNIVHHNGHGLAN